MTSLVKKLCILGSLLRRLNILYLAIVVDNGKLLLRKSEYLLLILLRDLRRLYLDHVETLMLVLAREDLLLLVCGYRILELDLSGLWWCWRGKVSVGLSKCRRICSLSKLELKLLRYSSRYS